MPDQDRLLLYLSLRSSSRFAPLLANRNLDALAEELRSLLKLSFTPTLRGVPSEDFRLSLQGVDGEPPRKGDEMIVLPLAPLVPVLASELYRAVADANRQDPQLNITVNADLAIAPADDVWCPQEAPFGLFGQRDLALAQVRAAAAVAKNALGDDVNVVILDQGLNRDVLLSRFPGARFVGGWKVPESPPGGPPGPVVFKDPGTWPDSHGTKMAETVLSVAPKANILDLPLLPSRILDLPSYLAWATQAYWLLLLTIPWLKATSQRYQGPWVLCNAWSVFDLRDDPPPPDPANYGENPLNAMNVAAATLPALGLADVVFAAGNCGQFCPDGRCAPAQVGPGRSIYGVAALAEVLTLGAVRGDETWLGYSSQGPSPAPFGSRKPDLCAPSAFAGPADWGRDYTGTSTSCALAAAAMAAARSFSGTATLTPAELLARTIERARPPVHPGAPASRFGAGILDIDGLLL